MLDQKDKLSSEIGKRIATRRTQLGLTQEQAAERSGLTQQFFASVETGTKNIRAESIIGVSKALNVSTDFLLTGTVSNIDCNRLTNMLMQLDEEHFLAIESIIMQILNFGGYTEENR